MVTLDSASKVMGQCKQISIPSSHWKIKTQEVICWFQYKLVTMHILFKKKNYRKKMLMCLFKYAFMGKEFRLGKRIHLIHDRM